MLVITALLLAFTYFAKSHEKDVSFAHAFIIGVAQAIAVLPGMSRSGASIATALLLKVDKGNAAKFSFLMVLLPILGKAMLDIINGKILSEQVPIMPLLIGFITSFILGLIACRIMIEIVKRSRLMYFAIYCVIIGVLTILFSF
jgi:undecaprenyl-diphosphatase